MPSALPSCRTSAMMPLTSAVSRARDFNVAHLYGESIELSVFLQRKCYIRIPESIQNILIVKYRNKSVEIKAIVLILL